MIFSLIIFIFCLSILQKRAEDSAAALVLSAPSLIIYCLGDHIPEEIYFLLCGAVFLGAIFLVLRIKTNLAVLISKAMFVSSLINLFGWVTWYLYMPPHLYVSLFTLYYIGVAYLLLQKGQINWDWTSGLTSRCSFLSSSARGQG